MERDSFPQKNFPVFYKKQDAIYDLGLMYIYT